MKTEKFAIPHCYSGYHLNENTLVKTASGGLATAISEEMIGLGGVVYGVIYSKDFYGAEYKRCESVEDLVALRGSKYVDVSPKCNGDNVYELVLTDLRKGKKVLFIGLPCIVGVLKGFIRKKLGEDSPQLLTVDLICHGPTLPQIGKDYAELVSKRVGKKVTNLNVRYKRNGEWLPPYLKVLFDDGSSMIKPFTATEFGFAFRVLGCKRCYECRYKDKTYESDITIGDYWGIKKSDEGYNSHGVSVALVHNSKGIDCIKLIKNFVFREIEYEKAILGNPYYEEKRKKDPRSDCFESLLKDEGFRVACSTCMTLKEKLRLYIPQFVVDIIHQVKRLLG